MSNLQRCWVKYFRDYSKKLYAAAQASRDTCELCGIHNSLENPLESHHVYSFKPMLDKWFKENGIPYPTTVEEIEELRPRFLQDKYTEIADPENIVRLCRACHQGNDKSINYRNSQLGIKFRGSVHGVYGKVPTLATAEKQKRWVAKMRDKLIAKYNL